MLKENILYGLWQKATSITRSTVTTIFGKPHPYCFTYSHIFILQHEMTTATTIMRRLICMLITLLLWTDVTAMLLRKTKVIEIWLILASRQISVRVRSIDLFIFSKSMLVYGIILLINYPKIHNEHIHSREASNFMYFCCKYVYRFLNV